jgi:hypothetical protein
MIKVDLPVVRVFTHLITARWETRMGEGRGLTDADNRA